ncbi:MAG: hypothetical protein AAFS07_15495 [Pseudomonadota bacterium]
MIRSLTRISAAPLLLALGLAGCGHTVQGTSGAEYLASYTPRPIARTASPDPVAAALLAALAPTAETAAPAVIDPIVMAAAVEPRLQFPARLGLARVLNGRLTVVPGEEAGAWRTMADRYGHLGTFVPVEPLIVETTVQSIRTRCAQAHAFCAQGLIEQIRLGAARQHLDAVLIYEVGARTDIDATPLAIADLTLIGGAILPTRSIEAEGKAAAILIDVRNGYPYGTATATADLSTLATSWGNDARRQRLQEEAVAKVVTALIPEVEAMMTGVVQRAAERRVARQP